MVYCGFTEHQIILMACMNHSCTTPMQAAAQELAASVHGGQDTVKDAQCMRIVQSSSRRLQLSSSLRSPCALSAYGSTFWCAVPAALERAASSGHFPKCSAQPVKCLGLGPAGLLRPPVPQAAPAPLLTHMQCCWPVLKSLRLGQWLCQRLVGSCCTECR